MTVRSLEIAMVGMLLPSLSGGCGLRHVRQTAATEFGCSESSLRVKELSERAYRVEGCGKAATYVCEEYDANCTREVDPSEYAPKTSSTEGIKVESDRYRYELPPGFTRNGDSFVDTAGKHAVQVRVLKTAQTEVEALVKELHPDAETWTKMIEGHPVTYVRIGSFSEVRTLIVVIRDGKAYEITCAGPPTKPAATDAVCDSILLSFRVN